MEENKIADYEQPQVEVVEMETEGLMGNTSYIPF